ncbi:hypothetical protein GLYMA_10G033200v4 [Glycine max]|nr:hypothetical protein GLYMA_10G033200v4 [Glycine max]KAH1136524.1 hypothetical protein GYH30_026832 [Glycine max]
MITMVVVHPLTCQVAVSITLWICMHAFGGACNHDMSEWCALCCCLTSESTSLTCQKVVRLLWWPCIRMLMGLEEL